MEKREKKWLKPLIAAVVVIVVVVLAVMGIKSYMASRSVAITMSDVTATVQTLSGYLIVLAIAAAAAIAVCIAVIRMKKSHRIFAHGQALTGFILILVIVVNMICMGPEYALINNVLGEKYELSEETIQASEKLVENIADEGIVLLKNENHALPMSDVTKLNVFGWSSVSPVYGGTGSGAINEDTCITLLQGLEDAGFELNQTLSDFYKEYRQGRPTVGMSGQDWTIPEPTVDEYHEAGIFQTAAEFSDTALVVISRTGGENADLPTSITDQAEFVEAEGSFWGGSGVTYTTNAEDVDPSKSYLELSNRETAMMEEVTSQFSNVIVVVNSANAMELGFLEDYDSIQGAVWCAGPGQTGFEALGRVLKGEVNPSGKLPDTYVYDLHQIPAFNYVGDFRYENMDDVLNGSGDSDLYASFNNYVEGIYVGYKFYETAAKEGFLNYEEAVQFPFGYGLSYTEFEQSIQSLENDGTTVRMEVAVKNAGQTAGKEVVEVYFTPPYTNGGIEKSEVNLIAYEKTSELAPGEEAIVNVSFAVEDMASYDSSGIKAKGGAYVLEAGAYNISIRSDSHTVLDSKEVLVDRDIIYNGDNDNARESDQITATNQFDYAQGDVTYLSRADGFANYTQATAAPESFEMSSEAKAQFYSQETYDTSEVDNADTEMPVTGADNGLMIRDMTGLSYDDGQWELLLDQLSVEEMNSLIATGGYASAKADSIGLPATIECDGPAAIKNNYTGQSGTAFPAAAMIAATWNKDLAKERGEMMGLQCQEMNVAGWYGPAMNIHRTPFSGRNFEYYSEDGVLSGYQGANEILGAKEYNVQTYMKHFALNDSETNRCNMLCTWTNEQALREIYLKSFEISAKVGGSNAAMTSFNYIGPLWAGANEDLLQTVLRDEWGFEGVTVTDWFNGSTDGYMMADSAIRTGGDKMLSSQGDKKAYASDTENASTVAAMRNAVHNILFGIANSNAMDERNFATPGWVKTFIGADIALAIVLILIEVLTIRRFLSWKKKEAELNVAVKEA